MFTIEITKMGEEKRKLKFNTVEEYCIEASELTKKGYKLGWDFSTTLDKYDIYFPFFEINKANEMLKIAEERFSK